MDDRQNEGVRRSMASIVPALAPELDAVRQVTDADEEIFLLYTLSAPAPDRIGLGQLNGSHDALTIIVDLLDARSQPGVHKAVAENAKPDVRAKVKRGSCTTERTTDNSSISITLRQDSTSLRSTAGDTGSIAWRSSVYLAAKILQDISLERRTACLPDRQTHCILSQICLQKGRILELGAGTGVLPSLVLSHPNLLDSSLRWIATDQGAIVPLLCKNLVAHPRLAAVAALDWVDASRVYKRQTPSALRALEQVLFQAWSSNKAEESIFPELVIATDCIYNPHLFPAFLDTLSLCARPQETLALVVCELREADMLREFLVQWLEHKGRWCIYTLESPDVLGPHLAHGSVVWAAWRTA